MSSRAEKNRVIPRLEPLEDRCLLSALSSSFVEQDNFLSGPRGGGVTFQVGPVLVLELGSTPSPSQTQIVTDGRGDGAISWDGKSPQFFVGVQSIVVASQAASNDIAFTSLGPLQSPQQLNLLLAGINNVLVESVPGSRPLAVAALPPVPTLRF
jgi:hypothetical protein